MPGWQLEAERLWLRRVTLEDADLMLAIWNDPAFVRNVGDRGVRLARQYAVDWSHRKVGAGLRRDDYNAG